MHFPKIQNLATAVAASWLMATAGGASAQLLNGLKLSSASAKPGEEVTVTVEFDVLSGTNCGVRLHWGDGQSTDYKINQAKDAPLVVRHAWTQPGSYTVKAEPKSHGVTPKCGGRNQASALTVSAPAPAGPTALASKPAPGAAMARSNPCPSDWALAKGGVGKNGAFTCTAKPATPIPAQRPACPGDLTYFENSKRGQLGCRA